MTIDQTINELVSAIVILLIVLLLVWMILGDKAKEAKKEWDKARQEAATALRDKDYLKNEALHYQEMYRDLQRQTQHQQWPYAQPVEDIIRKQEQDIQDWKDANNHNKQVIDNLKRVIALMNEKTFAEKSELIQEILELREELGRKLDTGQ